MQGFQPGKQKPKNYANGGIVKGPGTGTSDSVPAIVPKDGYVMPADSTQALGFKPGARKVNVSNGEAVLTPEQVQAAGGFEALDAMKAATHMPVPDGQAVEGPKFFFANGGAVDDEEPRRAQYIDRFGTPQVMSADQTSALQAQNAAYVAGAQAKAAANPPVQQDPVAPVAAAPVQSGFASAMERNQRALDASTASGPVSPKAAPEKPVMPTEVEGWRTKAVMDGAAEDAKLAWERGNVGETAGALARGAITAVPTAVYEFGANTLAPVAGFAKGVWDGLSGNTGPQAAPTTAKKPTTQVVAPAPAARATQAPAGPAAASTSTTPGAATPPGKTQPAAAPAPAPAQVAPGVYQHGRGQYSDSPDGMGFNPGFTGQPSAQNDAAAQALADNSMRGFRPAGVEPTAPAASQNLTPADTGQGSGFGLLNSNRIAIRNAMIDAKQGDPGAQDVLRGLISQQAAAPGQQIERDQMAQRGQESAADRALRAEELQSARGFRAGQLANDSARTALDAKKTGQEMEARGFEIGQAKRMETLRSQYEAAADPKVRADLAQRIRTLSGKDDQANRFTVVPGGQEWDATAGVMRNVPGRVLNNQTGQFVDGAGAGKALPPLKDNPAAMTIANDLSLSKEQRAAKLREMGYR